MNISKRVIQFFSLDSKTRFLFLETFICLGWARFLLYLPFTKVAPFLGIQMQETSNSQIQTNRTVLISISSAIGTMSKYTFWENKCLVKAIAGMKMLERRRIESTLYLGTAKDEAGELIAHAWLRSGPFYITGSEVMNRFTEVGKFANKISFK
jgi:hypothetical protein